MNSIKHSGLTFVVLLSFLLPVYTVSGADETIYGSQLMTAQEREQHREKMRSFRTEQEREAYRQEHHQRMQERARERGVTLPDTPMPGGMGMGRGDGPGSGGGMGQGGRR